MPSGTRLMLALGCWLGAGLFLGATISDVQADELQLTAAAEAAVRNRFPDGSIVETHRGRERGARFFEVVVRDGETRYEVEVTADGALGEVESTVELGEAPQAVRDEIRSRAEFSTHAVERHEVHAVVRDGRFKSLGTPQIVYEVEYVADGERGELLLLPDGQVLSDRKYGEDDDSEATSADDDSSAADDDSADSDSHSSDSDGDSADDDDPVDAEDDSADSDSHSSDSDGDPADAEDDSADSDDASSGEDDPRRKRRKHPVSS